MPAPSSRHARRTHASPSPSPSLPVKMRDGKLSTVRGPLSCSAELPLLSSDPACHRYASTRRRLRRLVAPTRWKAAHADGKCIAQAMRVVSLSPCLSVCLSLSLSLSASVPHSDAELLLNDGARAAQCNSGTRRNHATDNVDQGQDTCHGRLRRRRGAPCNQGQLSPTVGTHAHTQAHRVTNSRVTNSRVISARPYLPAQHHFAATCVTARARGSHGQTLRASGHGAVQDVATSGCPQHEAASRSRRSGARQLVLHAIK